MNLAPHDIELLLREHQALMRHCGQAQAHCSALVRTQAAENKRMSAQIMRLRAAIIVRDSQLAWSRPEHSMLEERTADLPNQLGLDRHTQSLLARLQGLLRELLDGPQAERARQMPLGGHGLPPAQDDPGMYPDDSADMDDMDSRAAADLVICQTGCISHGAYWREQDHCKRTGKTCVLLSQPAATSVAHMGESPNREQGSGTVSPQNVTRS